MDLKVPRMTVLEQTVSTLRIAIMEGQFKPGQRLVEADLCQRTGVSRTSIREALRRLEAERLIHFEPNRGPSVATISWESAKDIYAARALLEGEAAALCCNRITKAALAEMNIALNDFRAASTEEDTQGLLNATEEFYSVILRECGNSAIREILEGLMARITFLRARSMSLTGRAKHSAREMKRIMDAIAKGNEELAREVASAHVHAASKSAEKYYTMHEETPAQEAAG